MGHHPGGGVQMRTGKCLRGTKEKEFRVFHRTLAATVRETHVRKDLRGGNKTEPFFGRICNSPRPLKFEQMAGRLPSHVEDASQDDEDLGRFCLM